jgi:hypothetical protein
MGYFTFWSDYSTFYIFNYKVNMIDQITKARILTLLDMQTDQIENMELILNDIKATFAVIERNLKLLSGESNDTE